MRLPVWFTKYCRTQLISAVNTINRVMPIPMAHSVLIVWCTTTLSITTWVNTGAASAISCSTSEASSTSRQIALCLSSS
ncbi:MAG: hypothetical protein FD134_1832, partial [Gallionellaceae bacterium]